MCFGCAVVVAVGRCEVDPDKVSEMYACMFFSGGSTVSSAKKIKKKRQRVSN